MDNSPKNHLLTFVLFQICSEELKIFGRMLKTSKILPPNDHHSRKKYNGTAFLYTILNVLFCVQQYKKKIK